MKFLSYKESQIVSVNRGGHGSNIQVFGGIRVDLIRGHPDIRCLGYPEILEFSRISDLIRK